MTRKTLVFVLLVGSFALAGFYVRQFTLPMGFGDSGHYLAMAQDPGTFARSPWGYRIAVPYAAFGISGVLALPIKTAFGILQIAMFGLILTLIFLWISGVLRRGNFVAALSAALFAFSYPGVYNLHNIVHVGLGEHLFVLLGCMAIYSNRWRTLCLVTAVSCLVKESVGFLLIPTYFVSAVFFEPWRRTLVRTAVLSAAFLAPFLLLRSGVLFHNHLDSNTYTSFYTLDYVRYCWNYWGGPARAAKQIITWFAPLCLLSFAGFFAAPPRLKALVVLPVLAAMQIALATDVMRMVGVGIPVMIGLSSFAFNRMRAEHAALVASLSGLHFLCLNHRVGGTASLKVACVLIVVLFWMNRSPLLVSVIPADIMAALTKRWRIRSQAHDPHR